MTTGGTMRALVKTQPGPGLSMEQVPVPEVGPNDVLIEVLASSICGTDLHIYNWDEWAAKTIPTPMVIGHEFMGRVAAFGAEVKGLTIGQRVAAEGHITCGHCRNCRAGRRVYCRNTVSVGVNRNGSFADYVAVPAMNIFPIPDDIPNDIAAILDPLGNAVHTALEFDLVGEDVLITGAGPIGMMATAIARHVGARHIVVSDVNQRRLAIASAMGATRVLDVASESVASVMTGLGMTEGFDVGLEMSGVEAALHDMLETVRHGASIAALGIPAGEISVDWNQVIFKGLTIRGIYGRRLFETWYKMTAMLQTGLDVRPVITHEFPIDDFQEAFDVMQGGEAAKVILNWR